MDLDSGVRNKQKYAAVLAHPELATLVHLASTPSHLNTAML